MAIPALVRGGGRWQALLLAWSVGAAMAQTPVDELAAAAERWLASDQNDMALRDSTAAVLLREPRAGAAWLALQLPAAAGEPAAARSKGVHALATQFVLGHLRQQRATGMTFVGQYDALLPLQPFAGELVFQLLLDTPDWFPLTHRIQLVAPLRDLQLRPPAADRLDAVVQLVDNRAVEPEDLRRALAAALWQWGTRDQAQAIIAELQQATTDGDAEDRVQTTLVLADYWCLLREYKQSAATHRAAQALAKGSGVRLRPVAWYAAACVHALVGDKERALDALDTCAAMMASPDLDSSLRVQRSLFDTDPELASLRGEPRFAAIVAKAFPTAGRTEPSGR
ncbi:MAG: hypothetical protein MUC36_02885 [Planctomycetes bacterium]|jgi:hypothetical protein|nr:hypothetical protein [Planctomycetota bacterium]